MRQRAGITRLIPMSVAEGFTLALHHIGPCFQITSHLFLVGEQEPRTVTRDKVCNDECIILCSVLCSMFAVVSDLAFVSCSDVCDGASFPLASSFLAS